MSPRWQSALLLVGFCAAVAGGPCASLVRAQQCNHGGGFNPRLPPGLFQQPAPQQLPLILQQQQMQQQQLLRQLQQSQLMKTVQLDRQMRELSDKGPEALKAALDDPKPEKRLLAALTIGKHGPALTDELIERLTDSNAQVRQAARNSLIRLSVDAVDRKGNPVGGRAVDFGPTPDANQAVQKAAARKWRTWFERQQAKAAGVKPAKAPAVAAAPVAPAKDIAAPPVAPEAQAAQLGKELIAAPAERRDVVLAELRDHKGGAYTQALAEAIPRLTGEKQTNARDALAERLTRMTAATLTDKLRDDDPEVRRAAALACAMKELNTHVPDLIPLLEDSAAIVPPAARAALKSLTNKDFGPVASDDPDGQARVAAAWKEWWRKHKEP